MKPAGLLSQGEITGDLNLVDWLRERLGRPYVGLVHRLDRNTSGLMVVAKRTKAAQRLTRALQEGQLQRDYLAWVHGVLAAPVRWQDWMTKDTERNRSQIIPERDARKTPGAKLAVLEATPRAQGLWMSQPITLVEFRLETGRSHQIRVQASEKGHPLVGDSKYRSRGRGAPDSSAFGRPALHSHRLSFPHPMSGEVLSFELGLPADMESLTNWPP